MFSCIRKVTPPVYSCIRKVTPPVYPQKTKKNNVYSFIRKVTPHLLGSRAYSAYVHVLTGKFLRALRDYSETKADDVYVVNFGAHYHGTPEGDAKFKRDIGPLLESMAEVGEKATVVWR